ncbi:MAG: prolyl oligopeptidase family serine peptidase [Polaromonas sp.]|nr:prolyl oligopeptidase family serine peptidase [Polaromonas sp.]
MNSIRYRMSDWAKATAAMALVVVSVLLYVPAPAQTIDINAALGERIEMVKNDKFLPVSLQVTVFQPTGSGPFPVAFINHGKDLGNNHLQARNRVISATREFLKRGYVVVAPMRQGFAGSGGAAVGEGCNIEGNGEAQAEDISAVVRWLGTQGWADTSRMMMAGQSHGGLATIAYSQNPASGFNLFINFAGGLKHTAGCQWELALRDAFQSYGKKSKTASIWFYGENDSYFPPNVIAPAFKAFVESGGNGEMVAYGPFSVDSHGMFSSVDGLDIWLDKVLLKMKQAGLPVDVVLPQYGRVVGAPPPTGYAGVADIEALKRANASSEISYRTFLKKRLPRAFAIAPKAGKQNYAWGGDAPMERALAACEKSNNESCVLYAVDDVVVWKKP